MQNYYAPFNIDLIAHGILSGHKKHTLKTRMVAYTKDICLKETSSITHRIKRNLRTTYPDTQTENKRKEKKNPSVDK